MDKQCKGFLRRQLLGITLGLVGLTMTGGVSSILAQKAKPANVKQPNTVVGTWRLVSANALTSSGESIAAPFGQNPRGFLIYTSDGRMAVIISHSDRKPLSGDRISAPSEERAEAYTTFSAYSGRYTLVGDKVTHHVEISSVENWVKTDLIRLIKFEGERIRLITPPLSLGGIVRTTELIWERNK